MILVIISTCFFAAESLTSILWSKPSQDGALIIEI